MLYQRDARNLLQTVRRPIVETIITSPPYADLKDYSSAQQIGYGQDYRTEYLPALAEVFRQCYEVSKSTATMWIVVDTFKKNGRLFPLPFELASICHDMGWVLQDIIIWDKGKTLPWSHKGRLRNVFEYILFFSKGRDHKYYPSRIAEPDDLKEWWVRYPERYAIGGKNPSNIWRIGIPVQGSWSRTGLAHACPFAPELVERILLLSTDKGDAVLDPFAGSGTVVAQSQVMGRKGIGFEVNPDYVKHYRTVVLPEIQNRYRQKHSTRLMLNQRRSTLASTLRDLRLLKYGKTLYTMLESENPRLAKRIVALLVVRRPKKRRNDVLDFIAIDWYMKPDSSSGSILRALSKLAAKRPASKFGIRSSMSSRTIDSFDDLCNRIGRYRVRRIFTYVDGKTHYYQGKLEDSTELFGNCFSTLEGHGHFPLILSTVGIRQEIPKTWRIRNGK